MANLSVRREIIYVTVYAETNHMYVVKFAVSADLRFRIACTKATVAKKWSGQSHSNFLRSCKRFVSSHLREKPGNVFGRHMVGFRVHGHI